MNSDSRKKSSHVFYIILIILLSILVLNIIERTLLIDIEENKKNINPIYYENILNNIKLGKIILFILLFSIFIILINPNKLLDIVNLNIFSILTEQYSHLDPEKNNTIFNFNASNGKNYTIDNKPFEYITLKNKKNLWALSKTIKEYIMNTDNNDILDRIKTDIDAPPEYLSNLINSIKLENSLNEINYTDFNKIIKKLNDGIEYKKIIQEISSNDKEDKIKLVEANRHIEIANKVLGEIGWNKLDTSQYKKLHTFIKLKNNDIVLDEEERFSYWHLITFLTVYYIFEFIYELHSLRIVEKKNITPTKQIVASGNSEHVNIFTVVFNLIILIIILRIQNNKSWLVNSGLMNIDINRFLPLLLFISNCLIKIYFKFTSFITLDTFYLMKFISMFCNTIMLLILCNYNYKIKDKDNKDNKYNLNDIVVNNYESIFYYLPHTIIYTSLFSMFSSLYLININYYDLKIAKHTEKNNEELKYGSLQFFGDGTITWLNMFIVIAFNINSIFLGSCTSASSPTPGEDMVVGQPDSESNWLWYLRWGGISLAVVLTVLYTTGWGKEALKIFKFNMNLDDSGLGDDKFVKASEIILLFGTLATISETIYYSYQPISYYSKLVYGNVIGLIVVNIIWIVLPRIKNAIYKHILSAVLCFFIISIHLYLKKALGDTVCEEVKSSISESELTSPEANDSVSGEMSGFTQVVPTAGGSLIENNEIKKLNKIEKIAKYAIVGLSCLLLYKLFINYKKNIKEKKIIGGEEKESHNYDNFSDTTDNSEIEEVTYDIKPSNLIDNQIIIISIFLVILVFLYVNNLLNTDDLSDFIQTELLHTSNLNILRLLFFPFIIIAILLLLGGGKIIKTMVIRNIEKNSIGNFDSNDDDSSAREQKLIAKYSKQLIEKDKKLVDKKIYDQNVFRIVKFSCLGFILFWYTGLLYYGRISLSPILLLNIAIIFIYIYLAINVVYIFYKIYMDENVNNITEEIDKITEIKTNVKFTKGKINPEILSEIIEIDTEKFKDKYEEFIFEMYRNLYDILSLNNIYLTTHIANYIKIKLMKNKHLEEEFNLVNSKAEKQSTQNPIKLDINGKWINKQNKNNLIIYIYNKVGIVVYLNETSYNNMKIVNIVFKDSTYEFFNENTLLFTYSNEKIKLDGIEYDRLSNEFSTDNIIRRTLSENDIFKNLNYMVSIDKDSKYIGKYNLIEDLTKYNLYKKNGDPLALELEVIILNKILLIKAIRDKKYKEAENFNSELNKLESKFRRKMEFYKFDSNRDELIDINEIDNYVSKNYKLSKPGYVKIKTAIFDGSNLIVRFDKKITNDANIFKIFDRDNSSKVKNIDLVTFFNLEKDGVLLTESNPNQAASQPPVIPINFIDKQFNTFDANGEFIIGSDDVTAYYDFKITSNNYPNEDVHYIKIIDIPRSDPITLKPSYATYTKWTHHKGSDSNISKNDVFKVTLDPNSVNSYKIVKFNNSSQPAAGAVYTFPASTEKTATIFKNYKGIKFKVVDVYGNDIISKVNKNNPNIEILNNNTLKIKLNEDTIHKLNTSNNIKLKIPNSETIILSDDIVVTSVNATNNTFTLENINLVENNEKLFYPYDSVNGISTGYGLTSPENKIYTISDKKLDTESIKISNESISQDFTKELTLKKIAMERKIQKSLVKIHKTIDNFEDFDASIFGT
jgi:hypothetical protein